MNSVQITLEAAQILAERALIACGASAEIAPSVARSCVTPEAESLSSVGLAHLVDYCKALQDGRVDGAAQPQLTRLTPVLFQANARGGFPPLAFDAQFQDFVAAVKEYGIGLLAVRNAFTCGALGYYAERVAEQGLLAFAVPRAGHAPLVIDQSSSHSAFVNIQAAAQEGREIPPGWALDSNGQPTTEANAAMAGVLLAFGGPRGANIALMVELLAAGLTDSSWSLDAPAFNAGNACPGVGLCITGINPDLLNIDFAKRCDTYLERIESQYGAYIPGARRAANRRHSQKQGVRVATTVIKQLEQFAAS